MLSPTVLVLYSSVHGHARRIAEHVASAVTAAGLRARTVPAHDARSADPEHATGIVVVAPVHHRSHDGDTVAWMARHRAAIDRGPTLVLSVSLAAAGTSAGSRSEARALLAELVLRSDVSPAIAASIGGAVDHDGTPPFARAGLREEAARHGLDAAAGHDTDFTDWEALAKLEQRFLALLTDPAGAAGRQHVVAPSVPASPRTVQHSPASLLTHRPAGRTVPGTSAPDGPAVPSGRDPSGR
ncbi:flavodoxin domain-containing protein [Patulibacter sp.]|uniref:flavodoxin domain-containing protein n=1 Tax=Patulibacter sp. TaxID=1912859 RepID=UPI00271F4E36|nr:flavodoxin domain-containing protein [Patulibacter sp.]MDO9410863.1 flavodoxin domain-containing protein [Patulibacter sp.]